MNARIPRTVIIGLAAAILIPFGMAQEKPLEKKRGSTIVIPAGTKITVQLNYEGLQQGRMPDGKVTWPVKLGFTTAVPVGAKLQAEVITEYVDDSPYRKSGGVRTIQLVHLRSITIGEDTYAVETDVLELQPGTIETKFTLVSDLKIKR